MGKRLWVERNKDGSWDAFGEDGAHIKFGKGRVRVLLFSKGFYLPKKVLSFLDIRVF